MTRHHKQVDLTGPPLSAEDTRPATRLLSRFTVFALAVVILVGVLATRLFYLQVARGGYYAGLAEENRLALQPIRSARGLIYDRSGRQLVSNVPTYVVRIRPADLPYSERGAVVERLATLLETSPSEINRAIDSHAHLRFEPVRIASDIPRAVYQLLREEQQHLPGVELSIESRRQYAYGPLVSHLLGFTGAITAEELDRVGSLGYLNDDVIGKGGVELTFEEQLRGTYGVVQIERDAAGRVVREGETLQDAIAGNSLELTVDVTIQRQAEKALRWAMDVVGLRRGVMIVMNPQTGEILAMVSLPSYDNNMFARGISDQDFRRLLHHRDRPLTNFAISEQYPPGSTYKLVTGTGALADGLIGPNTLVPTRPYLTIGRYRYYDWNRRGFGPLNIYDGFGHSSDTFFYRLAGQLGIERLAHWARQYGFGERTGIDLPGEAMGIVPTNDWKMKLFNQPIYPGEVYQAGIGQGYDAATPLQVLNAYNALANGGRLLKPLIVRRVIGPDGSVVQDLEPQLIRELRVDDEDLETMRLAARRVLTIRHTGNLVDLPIMLAGKTGTAEFGIRDSRGRLPFHSWFAAFVPKFEDGERGNVARPNAELSVLAFAYDSRTIGNAATEAVKYFLQLHYDLDVDLREPELLRRGNFYGGR